MDCAPHLATDRLHLRPPGWRDAPFYCDLVAHPQVRRYLGGPVPWLTALSRFRRSVGVPGIWLVCHRDTGQAIGLVEFGAHKDGEDIELSYQFHPRAWGRGLAQEATARAVSHALTDTPIPRLIAETQAANAPSRRLLQRLGFSERKRLVRFGAEQVIFMTSTPPHDDVTKK